MLLTFRLWLLLQEHFDHAAYGRLFDDQLAMLLPTLQDAAAKERLASLRGNGWTNYIAAVLRHAGFRDQRQVEELLHDVVVKLLVSPGGLFSNYDQRRHGALDLRFKRSVSNAVKNIVALERTRRKYLPVSGGTEVEDLPAVPAPNHAPTLIDRFRKVLQTRHGDLAVAILDARLEGRQTKSIVGLPALDCPGRFVVKRAVQQIKALAREFAWSSGDPDFLRQLERLMDAESKTIARRTATTQRRAGADHTT
jgi:hypothetical protein